LVGLLAVFRLGHRVQRDKRLTTHVALVARAFGADKMFYSGDKDTTVEKTVEKVVKKWGGGFAVEYVDRWRPFLRDWGGAVVHLTMYGLPLKQVIDELRPLRDGMLVVVGGMKVEPEVFKTSDYNVAVTSQPHSEAAALAVFLDWLHQGRELEISFLDAELIVVPSPRGKKVVRKQTTQS
jgi:tRNA (cytidine56-2'-O)-methyltransferase